MIGFFGSVRTASARRAFRTKQLSRTLIHTVALAGAGMLGAVATGYAQDIARADGPLNCEAATEAKPVCTIILPAQSSALYLTVRDESGEKVERDYVRFGTEAARDLGYSEAMLLLYDVTVNGQRRTYLEQTRDIGVEIIQEASVAPGVTLAVASFDSTVRFLSRSGAVAGKAAIRSARFDGKTTLTYGAILEAIDSLRAEDATRKRIVLMTDGLVEDQTLTAADAISAAKAAGVVLDTFGLYWDRDGSRNVSEGREVLGRLARETGGAYGESLLGRVDEREAATFGEAVASDRQDSGYVRILGSDRRVSVELVVKDSSAQSFSGERQTDFRAGIDFDCEAGETLASCATTRAAAGESAAGEGEGDDANEGDISDPENDAGPDEKVDGAVDDRIFGLGVDDWTVMTAGAFVAVLLMALLFLMIRRAGSRNQSDEDSLYSLDSVDSTDPLNGAAEAASRPHTSAASSHEDTAFASAVPKGRLVPIGNTTARPYSLVSERTSIGRDDGNDLVVSHKSVSRNHAELHTDPRKGGLVITDLNSLNSVYVNGAKVQSAALSDGDVVRLGDVEFRYEES